MPVISTFFGIVSRSPVMPTESVPDLAGKRRIMVIGSGGAGKSTFARRIHEITGLPLIHLDREHWRPGWVEPPDDEWRQKVEQLAALERWIIDGNYGGTVEIRLARADAAVFFDFPRRICLWRVVKRRFSTRRRQRPDMAEGCPEHLDLHFLRWIWGYRKTARPRILEALSSAPAATVILIVRTRAEVRALLKWARLDAA